MYLVQNYKYNTISMNLCLKYNCIKVILARNLSGEKYINIIKHFKKLNHENKKNNLSIKNYQIDRKK